MLKQRTFKRVVRTTGIALHSGETVELVLVPAPVDTGIVFVRTDLNVEIAANAFNVGDTMLSTCLIKDGVRVATIEHLMAALAGMGIDNAYIHTGPELPILDGSAGPFAYLIQDAGFEEQSAPKRFIRIKQEVRVENGDKFAVLKPYDGFKIDFTIAFDHPAFNEKNSHATLDFSTASFVKEISRARTFGFMSDFEKLRAMNLVRGGSLDNAVVLNDFHVMNEDGLRYSDECVRHKILDALGDLYSAGAPVIGALECYKSGHALNNQLVRSLLTQSHAFEYVTFEEMDVRAPIGYLRSAWA